MKNVETIVERIFFRCVHFFPVGLSIQAQSLLSRKINQPHHKKINRKIESNVFFPSFIFYTFARRNIFLNDNNNEADILAKWPNQIDFRWIGMIINCVLNIS